MLTKHVNVFTLPDCISSLPDFLNFFWTGTYFIKLHEKQDIMC